MFRTESTAAIQSFRDVGRGHADVGALDYGVGSSFVEKAGDLGEIRVGVRVRGAAPDYQDGRVLLLLLGDDGGDPLVHQLE
jgi:hypothetical protein